MTTLFLSLFELLLLVTLSKDCTLKDGSKHECPVFDEPIPNGKLFTDEQLSEYDGVKNTKIYLVCLGEVFDVTKGKRFYGPDAGHYNGFVGKDGSRAFAVGGFTEKELIANVLDLEPSQINGIYDWCTFYRKDYIPVGKLIGFYYDKDGNPTQNRFKIEQLLLDSYYLKKQTKDMGEKYPRCNSQRGSAVRDKVWCSQNSGGISRDWTGVPRKFLDPTLGKVGRTRCACVPINEANDQTKFQMYDDYPCPAESHECFQEPPLEGNDPKKEL